MPGRDAVLGAGEASNAIQYPTHACQRGRSVARFRFPGEPQPVRKISTGLDGANRDTDRKRPVFAFHRGAALVAQEEHKSALHWRGCQSASDRDPGSASKRGSDAILMTDQLAENVFVELIQQHSVPIGERLLPPQRRPTTERPTGSFESHFNEIRFRRTPRFSQAIIKFESEPKRDPLVLRFERLAFAPSELVGVAETGRARVDV